MPRIRIGTANSFGMLIRRSAVPQSAAPPSARPTAAMTLILLCMLPPTPERSYVANDLAARDGRTSALGPKGGLRVPKCDFRFVPLTGHHRPDRPCRSRANSGSDLYGS